MHVHIDTTEDRERIVRLMQYSLNGCREDIDSIQLSLVTVEDALGGRLRRCRLRLAPRYNKEIEVEEVQADLDLAVNRALERSKRILQRRLGSVAQRRYA